MHLHCVIICFMLACCSPARAGVLVLVRWMIRTLHLLLSRVQCCVCCWKGHATCAWPALHCMLLPSSRQFVAILHPPPCAVSAYVTHGVFPNKSWQRFKPDLGGEFRDGAAVLGMHRKPWLWMAEGSTSWVGYLWPMYGL